MYYATFKVTTSTYYSGILMEIKNYYRCDNTTRQNNMDFKNIRKTHNNDNNRKETTKEK